MHSTLSSRPALPEHRSPPIRILIVDDSIVARAVLARILGEHADFEVVAQASSAAAAHDMLRVNEVDVILLDLEMPNVTGLEALPGLIARSDGARVLVVSSASAPGAAATISALRLGAADTLLKPAAGALGSRFGADLADRLRRLTASRPASGAPSLLRRASATRVPLECVGIGASTGGVPALAALFAALPRDFTAPVLITQHLPAPFMPYFAAQLAEMAGRPARVATAGIQPMPGEILLAPGDAHLTVARSDRVVRVRPVNGRAASGCLPSVDPMLASIGAVYGAGGLGIVLSGMGRDGAVGAKALVEAGGSVLVQDAPSSVVWGMPGAVADAGLAHAVLPPAEIARHVAGWSEGARAPWK